MTLDSRKIKQVPTKPGVYFFKDNSGDIIYIGKAKHLRNRVRSYFQKSKYQTPKNISMVKRINDIEWLVVGNEVEALLTEANLIKQHQPHYNVNLKDDKSFPYIRITKEPYPRVFITREIVRDGSKYFGPYTDVYHLRQSLKAVHKIFPVRSCDYFIDDLIEFLLEPEFPTDVVRLHYSKQKSDDKLFTSYEAWLDIENYFFEN